MKYIIMIIIAILTVSCGANKSDAGKNAHDFLPELTEKYLTWNETDIINAFELSGISKSLISGQPLIAAKIAVISEFTKCMSEKGAIAFSTYIHQEYELTGGIAVIINKNRLASVENILSCLDPSQHLRNDDLSLNPCLDAWEYRENNVTYYIMYAGTNQLICNDLKTQLPINS